MTEKIELTAEELKERAIRFYNRYGSDLEQIAQLLKIRLTQLGLAYTLNRNLPSEAITISTRVKPLSSFLKKLEKKGWPQFYYPTQIIQDLIGARVVCWFVDDCEGIMSLISSSRHMNVKNELENYIANPKPSGYRAIHLLAEVGYDSVQREEDDVAIKSVDMVCEIQIRTRLQDAWGDMTHEFYYKVKNAGVDNRVCERILSEISDRLANEDKALLTLREAYQALADDKLKNKKRGGFRDEKQC